ncbi:MAG: hypothetical protein M0R06_17535 [Sphaerochaeta sp.]|jgi:hypothetical protein|nr:hypothetical protein [Sphaerochaeta sp.]
MANSLQGELFGPNPTRGEATRPEPPGEGGGKSPFSAAHGIPRLLGSGCYIQDASGWNKRVAEAEKLLSRYRILYDAAWEGASLEDFWPDLCQIQAEYRIKVLDLTLISPDNTRWCLGQTEANYRSLRTRIEAAEEALRDGTAEEGDEADFYAMVKRIGPVEEQRNIFAWALRAYEQREEERKHAKEEKRLGQRK